MVLVYSDDHKMMLELISKGHDLAQKMGKKVSAVIIGKHNQKHGHDYIAHGADTVVNLETDLDSFKAEEYTDMLKQLIHENKTELILIGSNKNGKELAPRLAAQLNAGCCTDCSDVTIQNGKIRTQRIIYSGNAVASEEFTHSPAIITIASKTFEPRPVDTKHKGEIITKKLTVEKSLSKIIKIQPMKTEGVNVEDADIIVSCGRGLKNKDDINLINQLADALKGKTIGCSRPIAADLKWLSEDHWIGLSGHKVKPKLYIATGISGQIQHIAGMRDSGIIVAINKDPDALIFKSADYGIVGDLYEVVPKLTNAIRDKMK